MEELLAFQAGKGIGICLEELRQILPRGLHAVPRPPAVTVMYESLMCRSACRSNIAQGIPAGLHDSKPAEVVYTAFMYTGICSALISILLLLQ